MNLALKKVSFSLKSIVLLISLFLFSGCLDAITGGTQKTPSSPDGGVYRSDDFGETFVQKAKIDENSNMGNEDVLSLVFDPQDTRIVYAGTSTKGLLKSENKGEDWKVSGGGFTNVKDIFVSHRDHNLIFVIAKVEGVTKLLRTNDGGENWIEIFRERNSLEYLTAFSVNKADENIIYLGDARGGIYKTENAGVTWKNLLWADSGISEIVSDVVNLNKLYIVTVSTGILRTDNAGSDFIKLPVTGPVLNFVTHPTKEGIAYVSTSKGMGISLDSGSNWEMINTLIRPSEIGSRGLAIDPKNDSILYFVSDKSLYKSVDAGKTWKAINLGLNRWVILMQVDPVEPNVIYFGTKLPPPPKKNNSLFLF